MLTHAPRKRQAHFCAPDLHLRPPRGILGRIILEIIMKKLAPILLLSILLGACSRPPETTATDTLPWRDNLAAAATEARDNNRLLLLNFSGSDWCGWCKRLDAEVFSTPAFQQYAAEHLVPLIADFPRTGNQSPELKAQNQRLLERFQVRGFPTILLFSPGGELIGQLGYQPGGPDAFIRGIEELAAAHRQRPAVALPGPPLPRN